MAAAERPRCSSTEDGERRWRCRAELPAAVLQGSREAAEGGMGLVRGWNAGEASKSATRLAVPRGSKLDASFVVEQRRGWG
jgi:hypothetical protein